MEHREAEITRDPETGRVTNYVEHIEKPRRSGGGWVWGLIVGAFLVAGGIAIYASNEGSYRTAGAHADRALAGASVEGRDAAGQLAQQAGQALKTSTQ